MLVTKRVIVFILSSLLLATTGIAAPAKKSGASQDTIKQYVDDLKKNPGDHALREKIIKLAVSMKMTMPEEAEKHMARGTAYAQKAADAAGYKKAINEFEAAANSAPWLALAYYNLGVVQEKAGMLAEALQNLNYYVMAAPDARNVRDVKNKIYALEVDVEDMKAGKTAPAPAAPAPAAAGTGLAVAGKPTLELEAEKSLNIIKMPPPEKKSKIPTFIGSWFFKETLRGEEYTTQAFEIKKNAAGDLTLAPPNRGEDLYASVSQFEISDKNLKVQLRWKRKSVVGYWKTETYELALSDDGKSLTGAHNSKSIGGRTVDADRTLFRQ